MRSKLQVAILLFRQCTIRHWMDSWISYGVLLLIVAVGVGAFNGIRQASRAASANFGLFNEAVSGRSDFLIEAPVGPLDVSILSELSELSIDPDWQLLPVVEGTITQVNDDNVPIRQLRLVGLDLIALGNLPSFIDQGLSFAGEAEGLSKWYHWIGEDSGLWISRRLADESALGKGLEFTFLHGGLPGRVQVAGVLNSETAELPEDLVIGDVVTVQSILNKEATLDRVEVLLTNTGSRTDRKVMAEIESRLRKYLPNSVVLNPSEERAEKRASMTEAFRLNLLILSLIAILVGAYLILQALDAAVVRRRNEMATLRSLGVGASSLFYLSLLEALFIGVVGSFLGIGIGWLLAHGAVHLLADTVNALYFATSVEAIQLKALDWWLGLGLGITFSVVAGVIPARDAMQTPPAQILSRGDWSPGFKWLHQPIFGYLLVLVGVLVLKLPAPVLSGGAKLPVGGFLAAACWIFGAALLGGQLLTRIAALLKRCIDSAVWRIVWGRLEDGSSRHRLAVAGLVVAVGMVTGMLQMVGSFRGTIEQWFDVRFQAELYVSERGVTGAGAVGGIDPTLIKELESLDGVRFADTVYVNKVDAPVGLTHLVGADLEAWKKGVSQIWLSPPGSLNVRDGAEAALVSETFARRFDLLEGGVVELRTPTGLRRVSPMGIFADYGNEFGSAVVDIPVWQKWNQMDRAINMSLYLKEEVEVNALKEQLRIQYPGLDIWNGPELRNLALGIFDQTFRVTTALNGIGLTVAVIGLLLGLLAIFEESTRSWQTLDYLGFTRRRLVLAAGLEGAGIAFAAWLGGTLLGVLLGWLLISVINVQSFGWTLLWEIPFLELCLFGLLLVGAGYLCGFVAGRWWFTTHKG